MKETTRRMQEKLPMLLPVGTYQHVLQYENQKELIIMLIMLDFCLLLDYP